MCYLPLDALRPLYSFLIPWNAANEFVNATSPECHPEIHGTACSGVRRGGCSQTQMIQQMRGKLYFDILVYVIDVQKLCLHQKVQKMSPKYPAKTEIRGFCTFETFCAYFMQWNRKKLLKEGRELCPELSHWVLFCWGSLSHTHGPGASLQLQQETLMMPLTGRRLFTVF